jgi:hypothetical protein
MVFTVDLHPLARCIEPHTALDGISVVLGRGDWYTELRGLVIQ